MRMTGKPFPGWPHLACPALLAAAPLLCLYANPYPDILMRDQWRMAPLVVDYHTGNLRLTDIFIPHYDVSIVFYKALFLLNGIVLKLNMPAEFFLGLFLFFLYTCVFFFSVRQAGNNSKHTILMLAMVLVIMYSQAQSMLWHSSLIMVSFGMLLLLSVLAITFFDKFIRDGGMPRHAFLSLLCIALLVLGETTASLITLTAIIFLLAIHWITTKSLRKKIFIYSIAIVLLYTVAIALQILYSFSMLKSPHEYAFMAPISNFTQRLSYVINLFGASLYIYKTIERLPKWVVFASGATLIGLYFFAIISLSATGKTATAACRCSSSFSASHSPWPLLLAAPARISVPPSQRATSMPRASALPSGLDRRLCRAPPAAPPAAQKPCCRLPLPAYGS